MTGKEAAKASGHWLTRKAAGLFFVGGIVAVAAGQYFDGHLPAGVDLGGICAAVAGFVSWLNQANQKESHGTIAELVVKGLKGDIEQGKEDHDACMGQHADTHRRVDRLESGLNEVAQAVEEIKPGWKFGIGS